MAFEVRVPRLGWSMETGVFLGWKKQHGEMIKVGDILYELQGEKAAQEIESIDAGILHIPPDAPEIGVEVAVGSLLGYITSDGEVTPVAEPIIVDSVESVIESTTIIETKNKQEHERSVPSTPRARRVASELGVDWRAAEGSGRGGRIRERDVIEAVNTNPSNDEAVKLSPRRRIIARKMLESSQTTAPVTLTTKADATNLVSLRKQFRATSDSTPPPSFTDIIAKLVAGSLTLHPLLAGRLQGDQIATPPLDELNIGIAVDTGDGLLVVVLRDVLSQSLPKLCEQSRKLIEKARTGTISARDTEGSVFTVTNLGSFGIDAFTPIINSPESAILGLGAIRKETFVLETEQVVVREQMTLSLTFDHQVVDGADAARFLKTVRVAIENPSASLLTQQQH